MGTLSFIPLNEVSASDLLPILNKQSTREHLIEHDPFTVKSAESWIAGKLEVDKTEGCKVRAIKVDGKIAGWCGIQLELGKYEIAIVVDDQYWGIGKRVFAEILTWAKQFGHTTVCIHLLHTRPEYRFLKKLAKKVYKSELLGDRFITYEFELM